MRMKPREAEKHEVVERLGAFAFSGVSIVCGGDVGGVRVFGTSPAEGAAEVYLVVVFFVLVGGRRDSVGDVPVLEVSLVRW